MTDPAHAPAPDAEAAQPDPAAQPAANLDVATAAAMAAEVAKIEMIRRADYKPPVFLAPKAELRVEIGERTVVTSRWNYCANPDIDSAIVAAAPLRLNGKGIPEEGNPVGMELDSLKVNGQTLELGIDYTHDLEGITILEPSKFLGADGSFVLEVTSACYPAKNKQGFGLYKSGEMFLTQMETEGFRNLTFAQDRPDVMTSFEVTLVGDPKVLPVMLSNGDVIREKILDDGRREVTYSDPFVKPCYLFAAVAGDLKVAKDTYTTLSGRTIELEMWVDPGQEHLCQIALNALKLAMRKDEEDTGLEYQLNSLRMVASARFNHGAMENTGLMIFNSASVLADPEYATDDQIQQIEATVAHEFFHYRRGNRVTVRSWHDPALKEALTRFFEQLFAERFNGPTARIASISEVRTAQFAEEAGPNAHTVLVSEYLSPDGQYTATTYDKGAEIHRMCMTMLGWDTYLKGIRLYFNRFDGKPTKTEDLLDCLDEVSGGRFDLRGQFFRWFTQKGTPNVHAATSYDSATGEYVVTLRQKTAPTQNEPADTVKEPYVIPVGFGLIDQNGKQVELQLVGADGAAQPVGTSTVLVLKEAEQTFRFRGVPEGTVPSILRGFSAPVRLRYEYSNEQLAHLFQHDTDYFNRYEAGQRLARQAILGCYDQIKRGESTVRVNPDALRILGSALNNITEPAFAAQLISLPSEKELSSDMPAVDFVALADAREAVAQAFARTHEDRLREIYREFGAALNDPETPATARRGLRALRNRALGSLTMLGKTEYLDLAYQHAAAGREQKNMTNFLAGCAALCQSHSPQRERALQLFFDRWHADPTVMTKWLSVQTGISPVYGPTEGPVDIVTHLERISAIDRTLPNHMRGLYGALIAGNPKRFHDPSGDAYRVMADRLIEIAKINKLLAGMIGKAFVGDYGRLEPRQKELLGTEIRRILRTPNLGKVCPDLYDPCCKTLGIDPEVGLAA